MSTRNRPSDPWWANSRQVFKVDRGLIDDGLLMRLTADALRLYMICCYGMYRSRCDVYRLKLTELHELGWTTDQSIDAAAEIAAAGLLRLSNRHNNLEFRI